MRREYRERFPHRWLQRKLLAGDPGMHHGTCVTHVPWCMSRSLTRGVRGKRSRHSWRMRNPQFYVSSRRPMDLIFQVSLKMPKCFCTTGWKHTRIHSKWIGYVSFSTLLYTSKRNASPQNWIAVRRRIAKALYYLVCSRTANATLQPDMLSLWPELTAICIVCISIF